MMNSTRWKRKLIIHTKIIHHKDKLCSPTCLRNSSLMIRISNSIWQATQAYMKSHYICRRSIPFKRRAQDILSASQTLQKLSFGRERDVSIWPYIGNMVQYTSEIEALPMPIQRSFGGRYLIKIFYDLIRSLNMVSVSGICQ